MKAYLKKDPSRVGTIEHVYTTDYFQKRFTVEFEQEKGILSTVIDAPVEEWEVVHEEN